MRDMLTREELYEAFVQYHAYANLHEQLCDGDPRTSRPSALVELVAAVGHERCAELILEQGAIPSMDDARYVLDELLDLAGVNRRPRYGREIHPDFCDLLAAGRRPIPHVYVL